MHYINYKSLSKSITYSLLGVLALAAAAQVSIPVKPVPITLQSTILMAICLLYPSQDARRVVSSYIVLGLIGVPVFINFNSGLLYAMGPSGGYILGFWLVSIFMPLLREKLGEGFKNIFLCCLLGQIILYVPGVLWLGTIIGYKNALYSGFFLYIPSGLVKTVLLASVMHYIKK